MKQFIEKYSFVSLLVIMTSCMFIYFTCASIPAHTYVSVQELNDLGQLDIDNLTPTEQKRLDFVLNREVSPCGNEYSLAQVLVNPNLCPLSIFARDYILALVKQDYNEDEISLKYIERYASFKRIQINTEGSPVKGALNPDITIVVFSDFTCPHCVTAAKTLSKIVKMYPDRVAKVYKHFSRAAVSPTSVLGARASYAAFLQGKFWEMHDLLYSRREHGFDPERIRTFAIGLGLDIDRFDEDLTSEDSVSAINADVELAEKLKLRGTPSIFINGRLYEGNFEGLEDRIREEFIRLEFVKSKE